MNVQEPFNSVAWPRSAVPSKISTPAIASPPTFSATADTVIVSVVWLVWPETDSVAFIDGDSVASEKESEAVTV